MIYANISCASLYIFKRVSVNLDSSCRDLTVYLYTVKPVLGGHFQIDKTKVQMENGSLMKV